MKKVIVFFLIFCSVNVFGQTDTTKVVTATKGYPVTLLTDTVFFIHQKFGPAKPEERAANVSQRILKLLYDTNLDYDSLKVTDADITTDIMYGDWIINSVFDVDAAYEHKTRIQLAEEHLQQIKAALKNQERQFNFRNIIKRIVALVFIFVLIFLVVKYFGKWQSKLKNFFFRRFDKYLERKKLLPVSFVSAERQHKLFDIIFHAVYYIIIFLLVFTSLPFLFKLFPRTKSWGDFLVTSTLRPIQNILNQIVDYIPNAITIVVIYFVFKFVLRGARYIATEIHDGKFSIAGFYPDWALTTFNMIKFILWIFFFIVIFPYLPGSDSDVFKGFSVFLGLLISIGSSSAISNMLSGLVITYMRPFVIGDRVKVGDVTGDVIEKSLLVTRIMTIKNEIISVPNQFVMSGNTINYSTMAREHKLILYTSVTIGYDSPWQTIHQLLINAAIETEGIISEPKPFVFQNSLNDFYVEYQINAYTNDAQIMAQTYSNLHQKIQDKFNEAGVEIMSPHYSSLRDGNSIAIPDENKPKDYNAPSFKIKHSE